MLVVELFYTYGPFQRLFISGIPPILWSMFLIVSQIEQYQFPHSLSILLLVSQLRNKFTVLYWQFVRNGWKNYTAVTLLNDFDNSTIFAPSL
jgi:hypothetical protein